MVAPVIVGAAIAALGGLVAAAIQQGNAAEARRILEEGKARFGALELPEFDDLEQMVTDAELGERSAMEDIAPEDAQGAGAQTSSLRQLGEWTRPGITAAEQAMMTRGLGEIQRRNRADRESLARGAGGLGAGQTLALAQRAQSENANQAADVALGTQAQAQARALSALRDRFSMGRQRSQDVYGRGRDLAQAKDAMREANARFSLQKTSMLGDLRQRAHTNAYNKTAGMAGQGAAVADMTSARGNQLAGTVAGGSAALGRGIGAAGGYDWLDAGTRDELDIMDRKAKGY